MRFLHTADWHLGRAFHGARLIEDQAHLLDQFVALAAEARPDAILIAGDVYDRSLPPPEAVTLLDDTLCRLVLDLDLSVVLIAGNHDSPVRLDFASGVLGRRGLHIRGGYAPQAAPVVLRDGDGEVFIYPLPYAEPAAVRQALADDGEAGETGDEERIDNHPRAMRAALGRLRRAHPAARRAVLVGHAFVSGGEPTADSERPLSVGGAECVERALFEGFHYVALGHLHQPQAMAGEEGPHIRYAGSLLKYSFAEAGHKKSVSLVELDGHGRCRVEAVTLTPRREVRRISGELAELLAAPPSEDYLAVTLLDRDAPHDPLGRLRERFPNVLQLARGGGESGDTLPVAAPGADELAIDALFEQFFATVTGAAPTDAERGAFARVAEGALRAEREG